MRDRPLIEAFAPAVRVYPNGSCEPGPGPFRDLPGRWTVSVLDEHRDFFTSGAVVVRVEQFLPAVGKRYGGWVWVHRAALQDAGLGLETLLRSHTLRRAFRPWEYLDPPAFPRRVDVFPRLAAVLRRLRKRLTW